MMTFTCMQSISTSQYVLSTVLGCEENSPIHLALKNDGSITGIRDLLSLSHTDIVDLCFPQISGESQIFCPLGAANKNHLHAIISLIVSKDIPYEEIEHITSDLFYT